MLKTCVLQVEVQYDDAVTDPQALAIALDRSLDETCLLQDAFNDFCSDEHGTPGIIGSVRPDVPLNEVLLALVSVADVIEATYGHDDEGERIPNEPGDASAADIVEMLCGTERAVNDAIAILENGLGGSR